MMNMRWPISAIIILSVIVVSVVILPVSQARSSQVVRAAISSTVAQAYGKAIVDKYETITGFKAQTFVGPPHVAINRLVNDVSNIAITELQVESEMKNNGYVEIPFCRDGMAIITGTHFSPDVPCNVHSLTTEQLKLIFGGTITNWKELGGPDQKIVLIVPGDDAGAFKTFSEQIMGSKSIRHDFITHQSIESLKSVQNMSGALSFVAQSAIEHTDKIKVINVNGLSPKNRNYPLYQTFSYLTKGEPKGPAKAAINFGLSRWGVEIMESRGMHPIIGTFPSK
jgi:phosphate transport system substrate-binding protein